MTQEEKNLLLKDLCARLPYYPKCEMIDNLRVINNEPNPLYTECLFPRHIEIFYFHNNFTIKPYLRPMSSMTEEEEKKYKTISIWGEVRESKVHYTDICPTIEGYDWLNAHHFDYRGLIEKSLAIEVTEVNNPYKE